MCVLVDNKVHYMIDGRRSSGMVNSLQLWELNMSTYHFMTFSFDSMLTVININTSRPYRGTFPTCPVVPIIGLPKSP